MPSYLFNLPLFPFSSGLFTGISLITFVELFYWLTYFLMEFVWACLAGGSRSSLASVESDQDPLADNSSTTSGSPGRANALTKRMLFRNSNRLGTQTSTDYPVPTLNDATSLWRSKSQAFTSTRF